MQACDNIAQHSARPHGPLAQHSCDGRTLPSANCALWMPFSTLYRIFLACCGVIDSSSTWCMEPKSPRSMSLSARQHDGSGWASSTQPIYTRAPRSNETDKVTCCLFSQLLPVEGQRTAVSQAVTCLWHPCGKQWHYLKFTTASIYRSAILRLYLPGRGRSVMTRTAGSCMHAATCNATLHGQLAKMRTWAQSASSSI